MRVYLRNKEHGEILSHADIEEVIADDGLIKLLEKDGSRTMLMADEYELLKIMEEV